MRLTYSQKNKLIWLVRLTLSDWVGKLFSVRPAADDDLTLKIVL